VSKMVWIVFADEYDHSGEPEFLAAYDGDFAEEIASSLVAMIKAAGCNRNVRAVSVPLWPLVRAAA
jgi:hypothetical protein